MRDGPQSTSVGEGGDADTTAASGDQVCVPGQQVECACPGGVPGAQACREDGGGFGPCECGTDEGAPDESSTSGVAPPTSSSSEGGGSSSDDASDTDPQACLDAANGDVCQECICENCLAEHDACMADEGCAAIEACAEEHMCTGIDCTQPCAAVIEEYGGFGGTSVQLANALSACYQSSCSDCGG